jgi:hypothetical protein
VACERRDHFTPDAKESGGNGTGNELRDFIFYLFIYLFLVYLMVLSCSNYVASIS